MVETIYRCIWVRICLDLFLVIVNESFYVTDSPLNDGFGVVIVTVCIQKSADILLQSNESSKVWSFDAPPGCLYVLADTVRNAFDHGVICHFEKRRTKLVDAPSTAKSTKRKRKQGKEERPGRESLNFRFAIHGNLPSKAFYIGDEMPLFAS